MVVLVSTLQGRLEGIMVKERGEGVVVEAEAARHVSYVASLGCATRVQRRCPSWAVELVTTGFLGAAWGQNGGCGVGMKMLVCYMPLDVAASGCANARV